MPDSLTITGTIKQNVQLQCGLYPEFQINQIQNLSLATLLNMRNFLKTVPDS